MLSCRRIITLIVLAIMPFVLKYAALSEQAMHYLKYMLLINTYYIMGTAVNTTLIAGVLAMPKQRIVPKFRTTMTKELAATASVPRCPIITEYMEKATLQEISFPRAGRESFTKSENRALFLKYIWQSCAASDG